MSQTNQPELSQPTEHEGHSVWEVRKGYRGNPPVRAGQRGSHLCCRSLGSWGPGVRVGADEFTGTREGSWAVIEPGVCCLKMGIAKRCTRITGVDTVPTKRKSGKEQQVKV